MATSRDSSEPEPEPYQERTTITTTTTTTTKSAANRCSQCDQKPAHLSIRTSTSSASRNGRKLLPHRVEDIISSKVARHHHIESITTTTTTTTTKTKIKIKDNKVASITTQQEAKATTEEIQPGSCFSVEVGDIASIGQPDGTEQLVMICEMTPFHDSRMAVVSSLIFTRAEIIDDLIRHARLSRHESQEYLQAVWPTTEASTEPPSQFDYVVSTRRIITISNPMGTDLKNASAYVAPRVRRDAVYLTDSSERRICNVNETSCNWLKKIL